MGGKGCGGASYPAWEIFRFFLTVAVSSTSTGLNLLWGEATTLRWWRWILLRCWETSCLLLRWIHKPTCLLNLVARCVFAKRKRSKDKGVKFKIYAAGGGGREDEGTTHRIASVFILTWGKSKMRKIARLPKEETCCFTKHHTSEIQKTMRTGWGGTPPSLSLKRHYFEGVPGYCMLRQGVSTEYV